MPILTERITMNSDQDEEIRELLEQLTPHDQTEMLGYAIVLKACLKFHIHLPKPIDNPIPHAIFYLIGAARGMGLEFRKNLAWRWETLCDWWVIILWLVDRKREGRDHE
jgi:hypothetical protein